MRTIANRLAMAAVASCLMIIWSLGIGQKAAAAPQRTPVTLTRIFTGPDGQTHAELVDLKLTSIPLAGLEQSEPVRATSANGARFAPGFFQDWHPASARRYVITLSGRGEIEVAGGQKILLEPGRMLLAEDMTGKGHITRSLGNVDWTALFVQLER